MKRMVLVAMGLMLLAGSGFAQPYGGLADSTYAGLPDTAYVGLFADAAHTVRSVTYGGAPAAFQWYIFFLPSKMGLQAAEFKIQLPANIVSRDHPGEGCRSNRRAGHAYGGHQCRPRGRDLSDGLVLSL